MVQNAVVTTIGTKVNAYTEPVPLFFPDNLGQTEAPPKEDGSEVNS